MSDSSESAAAGVAAACSIDTDGDGVVGVRDGVRRGEGWPCRSFIRWRKECCLVFRVWGDTCDLAPPDADARGPRHSD